MNITDLTSSAALRQSIYSQAHQMSRQITEAAEALGAQSAARREQTCEVGVSSSREAGRLSRRFPPEACVSEGAPDSAFERAIANRH